MLSPRLLFLFDIFIICYNRAIISARSSDYNIIILYLSEEIL